MLQDTRKSAFEPRRRIIGDHWTDMCLTGRGDRVNSIGPPPPLSAHTHLSDMISPE